ncbi:hypothetical protein Hdeb2414_s0003g00105161 [Helianthus debilis subsp. tardiflorus]
MGSVQVLVRSTGQQLSQTARFGLTWSNRVNSVVGSDYEVVRVDSVRTGQLGRVESTRSTQLFDTRIWNIVECTLASHVLETMSSKS